MDVNDESVRRDYVRRVVVVMVMLWNYLTRIRRGRMVGLGPIKYSLNAKRPLQWRYIQRICYENDTNCKNVLRMDRGYFRELCNLLSMGAGLKCGKWVSIEEKLANFLIIIGHHTKNRVNMFAFMRSGHTISTYFHEVLKAVLQLHDKLLAKPEPITSECTTEPLKHFKGCLGALDGTYIDATPNGKRACYYRSRKGSVAINVLGVCDFKMRFMYVLTGWEGSAADGKVLTDAVTREEGALQIPEGNYYLVDAGYANAPGFLSPYRNTRYHLQEWARGDRAPQNQQEYFNLKHAAARNVIERTFGLLKKRFAILRSPAFYSIDTQNHIIIACCLLHNFLRNHAPDDLLEEEDSSSDEEDDEPPSQRARNNPDPPRLISEIDRDNPSWNELRDVMATIMYQRYRDYMIARGRG